MRKMTVTRRKTFAACLSKLNVYIEDNIFGDTLISGVKCRRLGSIKNGESKTYEIGEGQRKVFLLADSVDTEQWNEFFTVPAGKEDVTVSGKNHLNPFEGNLFRFDGNGTDEVLRHRRRSNIYWWGVCGVTAIVGFLIALAIVLWVT